MGNMNALGFAGAVAGGEVSLRMALYYHLQHNHYPPLPHAYAEVAEKAIHLANDGEWDDYIELPQAIIDSGVIPRNAIGSEVEGELSITVGQAVEIMHLDAFITWNEEELK